MEPVSTQQNPAHDAQAGKHVSAKLLEYPYPFKSAMAICSDLDETPDAKVYAEIARFLNTSETTSMGRGVDLEVGNSIYFLMPDDQYAYWTTDDAGREMAHALIRSGHIDVLHSYGDFATKRDDVKRCIDELNKHDLRINVWVDHSKAPSNFGPDIMVGSGDVRESEVYHADLTLDYGVRYVWRGRTTGVVGQNMPITRRSLTNLLNAAHPVISTRTMFKEAVKIRLGRKGHPRWEMYADNRVLRPSTLRDGQPIWEFLRSNPYWKGSGKGDTGDEVGHVLSQRMLNNLSRTGGVCLLYTHLGKVSDAGCPFNDASVAGLRRLASMQESGCVFVTTTSRLLRYLTVRDGLQFDARRNGESVSLTLGSISDPVHGDRPACEADCMGLTFELDRCENIRVALANGSVLDHNLYHDGNRTRVSIPWRRLSFPDI